MSRLAALRLRPRHTGDLTLEFKRDDPILRTAEIDAGDLLPRAVGDVNTLDIRRGLPGELFGALLRSSEGEVVGRITNSYPKSMDPYRIIPRDQISPKYGV